MVTVAFRIGLIDKLMNRGYGNAHDCLWRVTPDGDNVQEYVFDIPADCVRYAADIGRSKAFMDGWSANNTVSSIKVLEGWQ